MTGNNVGAATLDQSQTSHSHYQSSDSDNWQSFTAGASGKLTRLDLMWRNPSTTRAFALSIYAGQGTGGTLLHTQSILGGNQYAWVPVVLTTPVDVSAGGVYTYRVQGSNPYTPGTGMSWMAGGDPYPGGTNDLNPWYGISDYTFRTYVATVTPDLVVTSEGALIVPRMTTSQRDGLSAVNGMVVYNVTTNEFNFYENGAWVTK